ncbi:enoyl-CoA hydratase-related protein [Maricaulis sp.]|uniref:enoyl-CoA hydratase/isomerase family protein n=1 Tax=Maricaulis sp. TaxID=1486257 RepID=UPI00262831E7|nr:enoyl-CoA hydratase-related protein [Maricaulis sp.]
MSEREPFLIRHDGDVASLVLNRPDRRNAFTEAMWASLPGLLDTLAERCRVLVVRGAGDHFASGADISEFEDIYATRARGEAYSASIARALDSLARFPHPAIAAVRGSCVGGGCGLALACDLRFADTTARMAITPAKMGLLYPFEDTRRLVETVGASRARDMLFSARTVEAEEALRIGLVDRLAPPDALDGEIAAYCTRLMDMSPVSATYTKAMIARVLDGQDRDSEETRTWFADAFAGPDFREGYRAFLEKRKPDFSRREADSEGTD